MQYRAVGSGDVAAILTTNGTVVPPDEDGFVTLGVATYVFMLSVPEAPLLSVHIQTDATIAGTFTIEGSNFPATKGNMGGAADLTDWSASATVGTWVQENPTGAYVASVGTGWTWTLLSGAKTAGAGGAMIHLGNYGAKRCRLRAVVTTGGKVRVNRHAKG
jgi:hypothetical protein